MTQIKKTITLVWLLTGLVWVAKAQKITRTQHFNTEKNIAIQGFCPVAYFTKNKAVKGDKQFAVNAEGIVYYLSSAENKNLFLKDYKKYEPQYGGWCAYAMGDSGEKVEIDPETFKVKDGKLYLFYHSWATNTLPKWNSNETILKTKADENWSGIFK